MNRYRIVLDKAKEREDMPREVLPRTAAVYGSAVEIIPRPTERLAMILWYRGELPTLAFTSGHLLTRGGDFVPASFAGTVDPSPVVRRGEVKPATHRICKKCGIEKPLTREHWHRNGSSLLGFHTTCKACRLKVDE